MVILSIIICILILLFFIRIQIIKYVKQKAAYITSDSDKIFRMNQRLVSAEMFVIWFFLIVGTIGIFTLEQYEESLPFISYLLFSILLTIILLNAAIACPTLQRTRSFFKWNNDVEYNISLTNRLKDTVRFGKNDILSITEDNLCFEFFITDGRKLKIMKKHLEILNGWAILQEEIRKLIKQVA